MAELKLSIGLGNPGAGETSLAKEFIPFRFRVTLFAGKDWSQPLCQGAFSEVSGLEASMTPKALKEGGRNWGEVQLAGPTTFSPIILKRGITDVADLWNWFEATTHGANYALRYSGQIDVLHPSQPVDGQDYTLRWILDEVLPTKFKGPDLSATASQIALEELHLVHQGLRLERPKQSNQAKGA